MKHRMYIDEVGNPDLRASDDPNHRYLSLTGVVLELGYVESTVHPAIEGIKKRCFGSHPDEPIVLHRKELVNKKYPFHSLRDPETCRAFDKELLGLLSSFRYLVITTVLDKLEHRERYRVWQFDPYHYCLTVLIERYVMWLETESLVGDVMAESRGGKEDRRLKSCFRRLWSDGSPYVAAERFQRFLTSKELKVKPKNNNISGLQLADLIAHPSFRAMLVDREGGTLGGFGGKVARILKDEKYRRGPSGEIEGWGTKWLP